jgi:hypothetical protein
MNGEPEIDTNLEVGKWVNLECGEDLPAHCQIPLLLRKPPLVFEFIYETSGSTMTMYTSFTREKPNARRK